MRVIHIALLDVYTNGLHTLMWNISKRFVDALRVAFYPFQPREHKAYYNIDINKHAKGGVCVWVFECVLR